MTMVEVSQRRNVGQGTAIPESASRDVPNINGRQTKGRENGTVADSYHTALLWPRMKAEDLHKNMVYK